MPESPRYVHLFAGHYTSYFPLARETRDAEQLKGQIYLGSEAFIAQHQPDRVLRDIPRRQTQAHRPTLQALFQRRGTEAQRIAMAYRRYGYRLREIAEHLDVHEVTVSRRLKKAERGIV